MRRGLRTNGQTARARLEMDKLPALQTTGNCPKRINHNTNNGKKPPQHETRSILDNRNSANLGLYLITVFTRIICISTTTTQATTSFIFLPTYVPTPVQYLTILCFPLVHPPIVYFLSTENYHSRSHILELCPVSETDPVQPTQLNVPKSFVTNQTMVKLCMT